MSTCVQQISLLLNYKEIKIFATKWNKQDNVNEELEMEQTKEVVATFSSITHATAPRH
jgi:hypothetical protein